MSDNFGYKTLSGKILEIVEFEKNLTQRLESGDKKLVFGDQEVIKYNHRTAHVYEIGDEEYVNSAFRAYR